MNMFRKLVFMVSILLAVSVFQGCSVMGSGKADSSVTNSHSYAPYFTPAKSGSLAPDSEGFIRRWMLLEPIKLDLRTNAIFTESYVRNAFNTNYFPNQFSVVPNHGDTVTVADEKLQWHAMDATGFNVKLFRFATNLDKPHYGIIFWAVTVIESPEDMEVRMAVGSNSASMWWLNGQEAVNLFGDRRMVADDCMSHRLILKKGKNIVRGAVINGPGMSDFCVRFVDEQGEPVKNIKVSL